MSNDLIVMDNAVINAAYELSVNEQRLILSAIAQIPKNEPVDAKHAYCITRDDFIRLGVHRDTVAREIRTASKDLMKKSLFIDTEVGELEFHWLSEVLRYDKNAEEKLKAKYPNPEDYSKYIQMLRAYNLMDSFAPLRNDDDNVVVRLVFNERIVPFLSELRKNFTQFSIEDVAGFSSGYSIRIYQAMMQFKSTGYRKIKLSDLRYMLALGDKYQATKDLKVRVIETAVNEINDKSPYKVSYKLLKTGRKFTHLELKFKRKNTKENITKDVKRNADISTIKELSDKQLGRIARNQQFIADYNHLVSSTSPAGQNSQAWEFEMINRLKKDPNQFDKRPIKDYLDL